MSGKVAPIMAAAGGGAIVDISTAWAFEPSAMFPTCRVPRLARFSARDRGAAG